MNVPFLDQSASGNRQDGAARSAWHGQAAPTHSRRWLVALAVSLVCVAVLAPAVTAADPVARSLLQTLPLHDGIFRSTCLPSHVAMDDPIVHPGMPFASHEHEFFGNTTTDANSTYASLVGQSTTCRITADTAAYWVPTLFANGTRVAPLKVNAYYLRARARLGVRVSPFPAGLKLIAGDSKATAPQSTAIIGWRCSGVIGLGLAPAPAVCPARSDNVLVIRFPQCWNGHDLDSADHRSHLAYLVAGRCPAGYPVRVPQLSLNVHYRLPSTDGLTLSSGSLDTVHADFFNAWNQAVLTALVRANLN